MNAPLRAADYLSQRSKADIQNPVIAHTRNIWHRIHKKEGSSPFLTGSASIWNNPKLKIRGRVFFWKEVYRRHSKGIEPISALYHNNIFRTFEELRELYNLRGQDFGRFLQLRDCLSKMSPADTRLPIQSDIYTKLQVFSQLQLPHLAGLIYHHLIEGFSGATTGLKAAWEKDISIIYENDDWNKIVKEMLKPMRDARSKLIQFKIVNRRYWTPVRMQRAGLNNSSLCWRCQTGQGDIVHMFFSCPNLATYWERVMAKINAGLGTRVKLTPALCLLNSLKGNVRIDRKKAQWLKVALTTAKRVILRHWTGRTRPTYCEWFTALSETASYEQLIYKINGKMDIYSEIWDPFLKQIREI